MVTNLNESTGSNVFQKFPKKLFFYNFLKIIIVF